MDGPVYCFDLDDTLISEEDYVESGLTAAGALLDREDPTPGGSAKWLLDAWRRDRAPDVFQRLLAVRGLDAERWLPRLRQEYREHPPAPRLRGGALEVLDSITGQGGRLALVADGRLDVQRRKWAGLDLPYAFAPVIFTDARGPEFWKPHPWSFEQVMAAHPRAPRFFYVGDNPAKDFIAPNRLGWTSILVRDARNVHPPDVSAAMAAPTWTCDGLLGLLELCRGGVT